MIESYVGDLYALFLTSCPTVSQPRAPAEWIGPVVGAGVGALAVIVAGIITAMVTIKNSTLLRIEKHEASKREALSHLLALTYQIGVNETDKEINSVISHLKLLVSPKRQTSKILLDHLENIYLKPDMSEWRNRFVDLSLKELQDQQKLL